MKQAGGMHVAEALKRADATMETLREPSLTGIDDYITALDALLASGQDEAAVIEGLYARAGDIVSLSGAERNEAVQIAARSLCDLLDEAEGLTPSIVAGIKVYIASIKLLHRAPDNPDLSSPSCRAWPPCWRSIAARKASRTRSPSRCPWTLPPAAGPDRTRPRPPPAGGRRGTMGWKSAPPDSCRRSRDPSRDRL